MINDNQNQEVLLPTTEEGLDHFVASLVEDYELPNTDDTYDAIATMILHLPQTKAFMPRSYFGHGVLKSMANKVAFEKLKIFRDRREAAEKLKDEQQSIQD